MPARIPGSPHIVVHAPGRTSRHEAAFHWVLTDVLGLTWSWSDVPPQGPEPEGHRVDLHYGQAGKGVEYPAEGLLSELGQWRRAPVAMAADGPVDPFAAVFWMGSRMEEAVKGAARDEHGRFDPRGSEPHNRGWLSRPICEHWAFAVGEKLFGEDWPRHRKALLAEYAVVPTLDVDSAYAFVGKGAFRTGGALVRDVAQGRLALVGERLKCLLGGARDPYDTYDAALRWHAERGLSAKWFFLLADFGLHDKGLPPNSRRLAALMHRLAAQPGNAVHLHPGYVAAHDERAMAAEQAQFTRIMGQPPSASRQHYLRGNPLELVPRLVKAGVREDHTEGHAVTTGFRGGFSRSRRAYDLASERLTPLEIHPFAGMDATWRKYLAIPPEEVPVEVEKLAEATRAVGGTLRLLWHNESLAPRGDWAHWGEVYPAALDAAL